MATTLSFTQQGDHWEATATVNADYNLHLERAKAGKLYIYQRAPESGLYAICNLPSQIQYNSGQVIDQSFGHGVYPMHIKIVSESQVTSGTLTEAE